MDVGFIVARLGSRLATNDAGYMFVLGSEEAKAVPSRLLSADMQELRNALDVKSTPDMPDSETLSNM